MDWLTAVACHGLRSEHNQQSSQAGRLRSTTKREGTTPKAVELFTSGAKARIL
jgi:hypothetical protein